MSVESPIRGLARVGREEVHRDGRLVAVEVELREVAVTDGAVSFVPAAGEVSLHLTDDDSPPRRTLAGRPVGPLLLVGVGGSGVGCHHRHPATTELLDDVERVAVLRLVAQEHRLSLGFGHLRLIPELAQDRLALVPVVDLIAEQLVEVAGQHRERFLSLSASCGSSPAGRRGTYEHLRISARRNASSLLRRASLFAPRNWRSVSRWASNRVPA